MYASIIFSLDRRLRLGYLAGAFAKGRFCESKSQEPVCGCHQSCDCDRGCLVAGQRVETDCPVQNVDYQELRARLIKDQQVLEL